MVSTAPLHPDISSAHPLPLVHRLFILFRLRDTRRMTFVICSMESRRTIQTSEGSPASVAMFVELRLFHRVGAAVASKLHSSKIKRQKDGEARRTGQSRRTTSRIREKPAHVPTRTSPEDGCWEARSFLLAQGLTGRIPSSKTFIYLLVLRKSRIAGLWSRLMTESERISVDVEPLTDYSEWSIPRIPCVLFPKLISVGT